MNHQTAKIIAEAYRAEARGIRDGDSSNPVAGIDSLGWRSRSALLHDHAAVWERVAEALPPLREYPYVP